MCSRVISEFITKECGFKKKFGLYCPGCGGSRALEELVKFDIVNSLRLNPIVLLLFITLIFLTVTYVLEKKKIGNKNYPLIRRNYLVVFLVFWLVFSIIRNILLIYFGIDVVGDFL